jgi:hypothetical protein
LSKLLLHVYEIKTGPTAVISQIIGVVQTIKTTLSFGQLKKALELHQNTPEETYALWQNSYT